MPSYSGIVLTILVALPLRTEPQGLCSRQLDIALIIDQSGSILTDSNSIRIWQDSILEFAASLVHVLPIGPDMVRLGVVKFSTNARVAINMDEYQDTVSLELAVRDLEYGGGETNIAEGLNVARNLLNDSGLGARNGVQKIAVLISDGRANLNKSRTQVEGNSIRAAGVEIFCIGVTNQTNEVELKGIASKPTSTHYYFISDRNVLNKTVTSILAELCTIHEPLANSTISTNTFTHISMESTAAYNHTSASSMSIATTRPNISAATTTTLGATTSTTQIVLTTTIPTIPTTSTSTNQSTSMRITTPTASPTSTPTTQGNSTTTYSSTTPTTSVSTISNMTISSTQTSSPIASTTPLSATPRPTCSKRADIVLLIDESRDEVLNGYNWYDFIRGFAVGLINALPIAPNMVRIGLVTYNTVARVAINLGQYSDVASLERAIRNILFRSGDRNTADALNAGRNLLFSTKRGARSGLDKAAFLITNGQSSSKRGLTQWEADITKSAGIEIFSIGVTNQTDETELKAIASVPTSTHYYSEPSYNSVIRLVDRVLKEYCTLSQMTPSSSVVSTTISTTVDDATRQNIEVNTTRTATATTKTTTRSNISATTTTTPETTTSTTQITLTTTTTPTTPSTSTSTSQSTNTMTATPTASTNNTQTTQSKTMTTYSLSTPTASTSTTQSTYTMTTTPAGLTTSTQTTQRNLPTTTSSTTPNTSTSTSQSTSMMTTTPTALTTSTQTTQSNSTTTYSLITPTTSTSTTQSTSTMTTTPAALTISTQTTQRNLPTTTSSTTPTTGTSSTQSSSTTSSIPSAPTTSTSAIQSTSSTTIISTLSTWTTSTSTTHSTSASVTTPSTPARSASTVTSPTASTSEWTTNLITETTESTNPTTTVIPCPKEIDIVLILDETTSIVAAPGGYGNWIGYILGFAEGFINAFQVDPEFVRIGVVKFSWFARIVITLDQYSDAANLVKAVRRLEIDGGQTNIADGLRVGRSLLFNTSLGAREGAKKMAFLVTDGRANVEFEMTQTEANITKASGVEIYCIGVTSMIYEVELKSIASAPTSTHYYFVTDYNMLNEVLEKLRGTICFALQQSSTVASTPRTT